MTTISAPLSRRFAVGELRDARHEVVVDANAAERAALAKEFSLPGIERLEGTFHFEPFGKQGIEVTGRVRAAITRICVVSLEAFHVEVDEPVDLRFAPENEIIHSSDEDFNFAVLPDVDPPDPIVDGRIDLGKVTAEFLALSLESYPRKPGIAFDAAAHFEKDQSPFADLQHRLAAKNNQGKA